MGGAERSVLALARWLHEHDLPAHIVTYTDLPGLASYATYPLQVLQLRPAMDPVHKVLALRRHFAGRPGAPAPLASGYQAALHAALAGIRGFHCLMHDTPSLFTGATEGRSLKQRVGRAVSDRIAAHGLRSGGQTIVTSNFLRADSRKTFGVDAQIVRMGGLAQTAPPRLRPVAGTLKIMSVSRLETNKRLDWVLRALAQLERREPPLSTGVDWRLDIAGEGSQLAQLRTLTHELGLTARVHFAGYVSDSELQELYDGAHLFLMPAVQGYGIPAIESLQRGIPVLLHRDSGVSDIFLDTPWVTILDGDESSLLPALTRAIEGVRQGRHLDKPLPMLPSEDAWAEEVALLCNWL